MGIVDSLNRLDRRVLGPVRPQSALQQRNMFLIGLAGTVFILLLAVTLHRSLLLSGAWGFVGVMLGGGTRWYASASTPEDERYLRPLLGAGGIAVLLLIGALATTDHWNKHQRFEQFTPGPYFQKPEPTMVVLCPQTPDGDAYTYQGPASETPKCRNGAVPKVVVRG